MAITMIVGSDFNDVVADVAVAIVYLVALTTRLSGEMIGRVLPF